MKKIGLGRGLSSLIPKKQNIEDLEDKNNKAKEGGILYININLIDANPYQPREYFTEESLSDLSASIKKHGILQPLLVNEPEQGRYELIAGERRLRASKKAGLEKVPVIIKNVDNYHKLQIALLENIQRSDLNSLEEAKAFEKLSKEFKMTHKQISKQVNKSRSFITNSLRLLNLPNEIQKAIIAGKIGSSQSRSLVSLPEKDQKRLFKKIISQGLTAHNIEDESRKILVKSHSRVIKKDPIILDKEERIEQALGTKVSIKKRNKTGQIIIDFYSLEELDNIVKRIIHAN
ncbi:MAG: ParB/RepB/Spo0J family partition protein [Xanthomonadaceae bacterium]|nr:ParB/RepB/Spo0J family partition protein [Rhodospirillaceae bacterium]NIA17637.1 ParB/RepB/Spo0J family partition protein [Xanthomonadaceae bacterium]